MRLIGFTLLSLIFLQSTLLMAEDAAINFVFPVPIPKDVTINAGDKVTWTGASTSHPLEQVTGQSSDTATSGGFSATSSPFQFQFDTPGTYYYRCSAHGVFADNGGMRGSITVLAAGQPTAAQTSTPSSACGKPESPLLTSPVNEAAVTKAAVSLNWEDVECAKNYTVIVRKGKKSGKIVDQKTVKKSSYKTVKLEKKFTYYWVIKACNGKLCKSSTPFSFTLN